MNYTHALHLMSGETITITEIQAKAIQQALISGAEWLPIGKELVNSKSVAKIGYHHATSDMKKREDANIDRMLELNGKGSLVDERRALAEKIAVKNTIQDDRNLIKVLEQKSLPMSETESERGDADYYLNEFGEKMYN